MPAAEIAGVDVIAITSEDLEAAKDLVLGVVADPAVARKLAAAQDFGINVQRSPVVFVDVHLHRGEIYHVKELASGSGWGTVTTPTF